MKASVMTSLTATLALASAITLVGIAPRLAFAQVQTSGKQLSLDIAVDAAREALRNCEASGYKVSVSVVDVAGVERAFLRGDHSTIHTRETAFKKAYTIATLGPIFGANTTGTLTERVNKTPTGPALASVNNIILLAGGVALKSADEVLAGIGVGGAPGGALDEVCAIAGVAKVQDRLNSIAGAK